jgi:hypothetical protein
MMRSQTRYFGAALGFGFAWLIVQYGFFPAFFVATSTVIGWTLGRILDGDLRIGHFIRRIGGDDLD